MIDAIVRVVAQVLTWAFVLGMAGCIVVIPVVAYRLVSVLFEKDRSEED